MIPTSRERQTHEEDDAPAESLRAHEEGRVGVAIRVYCNEARGRYEAEVGDVRASLLAPPESSDWGELIRQRSTTRRLRILVTAAGALDLMEAASDAGIPPTGVQVDGEAGVYLEWVLPLDQLLMVTPFDAAQTPKSTHGGS